MPSRSFRSADRTSVSAFVSVGMVAGEGVAVDDEDSEGAVEEDGTRGVAEREA